MSEEGRCRKDGGWVSDPPGARPEAVSWVQAAVHRRLSRACLCDGRLIPPCVFRVPFACPLDLCPSFLGADASCSWSGQLRRHR